MSNHTAKKAQDFIEIKSNNLLKFDMVTLFETLHTTSDVTIEVFKNSSQYKNDNIVICVLAVPFEI